MICYLTTLKHFIRFRMSIIIQRFLCLCLLIALLTPLAFSQSEAHADSDVWEKLLEQYSKTVTQSETASTAQDAKRAILKSLSQGDKVDRYLEKNPENDVVASQAIDFYLGLSEIALNNAQYDSAIDYAQKSIALITRSEGKQSKALVRPKFIRIAAEKYKANEEVGSGQWDVYFSDLIAFSEKVNGEDSQEHFTLLERCALFIFERNPQQDKLGIDDVNVYERESVQYYHFNYAFVHRLRHYTDAGSALGALYIKQLKNPERYRFERTIPALYFLAQYKHVRGGFNAAMAVFEQIVTDPESWHFRYQQHLRLSHHYIFQYYQHREAAHLADAYWQRLYPPSAAYRSHVIFSQDITFPDDLYKAKKSDEVTVKVTVNAQGYVDLIHDVSSQHNSKAAIDSAKSWLETVRYTPHYQEGVLSAREETLHIPFNYEVYASRKSFRDGKSTTGYVKRMADHFFPGL